MIKIAVLSGKGGTGKTVVTSGIAYVMDRKQSLADCDVEAANLSLVLNPRDTVSRPYYGLEKASIDPDVCISCGKCMENCRFEAIEENEGIFTINKTRCEGCGVCGEVCPAGAIGFSAFKDGEIYFSRSDLGRLSHAELTPGSGTSGLLVHEVKKEAILRGSDNEVLLVDGPPGTGCPVISTISGMNYILMVTEPSISAIHDLKRLLNVSRGFDVISYVVINRYDLDIPNSDTIEEFCRKEGIKLLGRIPFDPMVLTAVQDGEPVTSYDTPASEEIKAIFKRLMAEIGLENE